MHLENKNTAKKTKTHINLLTEYLHTQNEQRNVNEIPPEQLNDILSRFVLAVRKKNGEEFEPSTLRGMMSSVQRHLNRYNYKKNLFEHIEFVGLREALKSKQKDLKSQGKGNRENKAEALTDEELDELYTKGQLGLSSPGSLLNTVWFYNCVYFGMRGGKEEHRKLSWGDVTLERDSSGVEYIQFRERLTKTRTGENVKNTREKCPRAWANPDNPDRCPVAAYKLYRQKRPSHYSDENDPYYIAPITHDKNPDLTEKWYLRQPVGVNKLGSLMSVMAKSAGLNPTKKLTNHSARKYLVQTLRDQNVAPCSIMQVTGHKNVNSITNYSDLSENNQHYISDLLSHRTVVRPALTALPPTPQQAALPPLTYLPTVHLPVPPPPAMARPALTTAPTPHAGYHMPHYYMPPMPSTSTSVPAQASAPPAAAYPIPGPYNPTYSQPEPHNHMLSQISNRDQRMFQNCYIGKLVVNNYNSIPKSPPRKRRCVIYSDSDESQSQ